ncbi:MAG: hypothetical protein RBT30_03155 [Patescibacteria group bacterium]|jgi:hypothetical protein|nr:hypothetical protein [Patescibacteria group bacterium]
MNIRDHKLQTNQKKGKSFWLPGLSVFLVMACFVSGIFYLIGMNDLTVKGFELKDLKNKVSVLAEENQDLHAKALHLQSYTALSPRLDDLEMVAVENILYLNPQAAVVAKK